MAGAGPAARDTAHHARAALLRGPHGPGDRGHPQHQCRHGQEQHLALLRRLREDEVLSFGRDEEESFGELVA
ncbi:hypothetical protein NKH77_22280 [Streptomyces sp. M19]